MAEICIKLKPDSQKIRIEMNQIPEVYLKGKAEHGNANTELVSTPEKILGGEIYDSSHRSQRKKIKVSVAEKELRRKLSEGM